MCRPAEEGISHLQDAQNLVRGLGLAQDLVRGPGLAKEVLGAAQDQNDSAEGAIILQKPPGSTLRRSHVGQ